MQELKTVARPYAKALFSVASGVKQCESWLPVLQVLACASEQEGFEGIISNPAHSFDKLGAFLFDLVMEQVPEASSFKDEIIRFISVLYKDKRLVTLPYILDIYRQLWVDSQDAVSVEVTSAFDLNDQQKNQFTISLTQRFSSEVDITFKTDASLIGGAIIRRGSWVMDGSVHGKLSNLIDSMRG